MTLSLPLLTNDLRSLHWHLLALSENAELHLDQFWGHFISDSVSYKFCSSLFSMGNVSLLMAETDIGLEGVYNSNINKYVALYNLFLDSIVSYILQNLLLYKLIGYL